MTESLHKKTIAILVAAGFEDATVIYPVLNWSGLGADIQIFPAPMDRDANGIVPTVGLYGQRIPMPGLAEGHHYTMCSLREVKVEEIDAVMIPGGLAADVLRQDARVLDLIADLEDRTRILAAIGHGVQTFISTDSLRKTEIIRGHRICGPPGIAVDIGNAGGNYEDEAALVDGGLVTARTADNLPEFCDAVALALISPKVNRKRR